MGAECPAAWERVEPVLCQLSLDRGEPDRSEEWVHEAWQALERSGLTAYDDMLSFNRVLVRALTLMTLYREFADLAWDEGLGVDIVDWAEQLRLSPVRVGQLLGPRAEVLADEDGADLYGTALQYLIDHQRAPIHAALIRHFGNTSMLFASLYATSWESSWMKLIDTPEDDDDVRDEDELDLCEYEADDDDDEDEVAASHGLSLMEILNDNTCRAELLDFDLQKMPAFTWIDEGMYSREW